MCQTVTEALEESRVKGKDEGIQETRIELIQNIMDSLNVNVKQAMSILKIPLDEQKILQSMITVL